jgi:hypothetical protein
MPFTKFLTNGKKRFLCEVMFETEGEFCCEHTMFSPVKVLRNWSEQWPSKNGDLESNAMREVK